MNALNAGGGPGPTTTTTTNDPIPGGCAASLSLKSWDNGFVATVKATADSSALRGWRVTTTLSPATVACSWSANRSANSGTVWMRERQIEAMYRARSDERRHATEALDNLFVEAASGRSGQRAWPIAAAHPFQIAAGPCRR